MLKFLRKLAKTLGFNENLRNQVFELFVEYVEELYETYGKEHILDRLNPRLEKYGLKLIDTQPDKLD